MKIHAEHQTLPSTSNAVPFQTGRRTSGANEPEVSMVIGGESPAERPDEGPARGGTPPAPDCSPLELV